jgi:branched-chain amino acid transport system substrate-binding protein
MRSAYEISRRTVIKGMAGLAGATSLGRPALAASRAIKIGVVVPQSGPLALFAENTGFVVGQVNKVLGGQIKIGGTNRPYEVLVKDSQSSPNRAAEVALDLILKDKVDIICSSGTPETTNPVSDQCELNGVPCITTVTPLEAWFLGRKGDPVKGFDWTFNFFMPAQQGVASFINIWKRVPSNHRLGILFPNDIDGNTFAHIFPGIAKANGIGDYPVFDPGRFDSPVSNFSTQIEALKSHEAEVCFCVAPAPDFTVFWNQAAQQGYRPKVLTAGKVGEFPAGVDPLGDRAININTEVWWSRFHPFSSSLTGQSSGELADAFEDYSRKQAAMALGYDHAMFELVIDALKRSQDPTNRDAVRDAIRQTDLKTIVGQVNFQKGPFPNTAATPVVGGQWRKGKKWPLELALVDNTLAPMIPVTSEPEAIAY